MRALVGGGEQDDYFAYAFSPASGASPISGNRRKFSTLSFAGDQAEFHRSADNPDNGTGSPQAPLLKDGRRQDPAFWDPTSFL
jgi:hypothetical protein